LESSCALKTWFNLVDLNNSGNKSSVFGIEGTSLNIVDIVSIGE